MGVRTAGLVLALVVLGFAALLSLSVGARSIPLAEVVEALRHGGDSRNAVVVADVRVPRTLLALAVGVALGIAGALMQALTRNPLADPGLLGVNAGAAAAVVIAIGLLGITGSTAYVWPAFLGAALAAVAVYAIGSAGRGGPTPVRLALAGTAITAALTAIVYGIALTDDRLLQQYNLWSVGALNGRGRAELVATVPFMALGALVAVLLARPLNALALGRRFGACAGRARRARARGGRRRDHAAVRRGDGRRRPDVLPRPDRSARRAHDLRTRSALGARVLGRIRWRADALRRRARPRARAAERAAGRADARRGRRTRVHRDRPAAADRRPVMAVAGVSERLRIPGRVIRLRGGLSLRVQSRPVVVAALLACLTLALAVIAVGTGELAISPGAVVTALLGGGDPGTAFIVRELRLPRALCAVLVGVALGMSGAIFQSLTRNPLGSPDILGLQQGAAVGALIVITVLELSGAAVSAGALAGGALAALAVYALSFKHGGVASFRLVLIGIAVAAVMLAFTEYLLSRARIEDAQEAMRWLLGSLSNRGWEDLVPLLVVLALLAPAIVAAGPPMRALELGDDAAYGLGLRVERARLGLILLAVGLVSITTVAVGPIVFIALTAPQIARRIARTAAPTLTCSALTGAVLVLGADVAAQRLVPETPLPVGVMTGAFGGLYLAWLLATEWRAGHA